MCHVFFVDISKSLLQILFLMWYHNRVHKHPTQREKHIRVPFIEGDGCAYADDEISQVKRVSRIGERSRSAKKICANFGNGLPTPEITRRVHSEALAYRRND